MNSQVAHPSHFFLYFSRARTQVAKVTLKDSFLTMSRSAVVALQLPRPTAAFFVHVQKSKLGSSTHDRQRGSAAKVNYFNPHQRNIGK